MAGAIAMEGRDPLAVPLHLFRDRYGHRLNGARWNGEQIESQDLRARRCVRCDWKGQLARLGWDRGSSLLLCLICRHDERARLRRLGIRITRLDVPTVMGW